MPKLRTDELKKRFACDECGATFRTRQGRAGHAQFKHNKGSQPPKAIQEPGNLTEWIILERLAGSSEAKIAFLRDVFERWTLVRSSLHALGPSTDQADFKTFVIANVATADTTAGLSKRLEGIEVAVLAIMDAIERRSKPI
jgi:hypothetical protein